MRETTCKEFLRYDFNQDEKLELGRELAKQSQEKHGLEDDKKRITSDFKARIDAREAEIGSISGKLYAGYEYRNIECQIVYNSPNTGFKTIYRIDTGEVVREMPMTGPELQEQIPFPAPEKTSEENIADFFKEGADLVRDMPSTAQVLSELHAAYPPETAILHEEPAEVEEPHSGEAPSDEDPLYEEYLNQEATESPEEPHEVPAVSAPVIVEQTPTEVFDEMFAAKAKAKRKVKSGWPGKTAPKKKAKGAGR